MLSRKFQGTAIEVFLIVAISASAGILWNRSLLASVWRGEVAPQSLSAAPKGVQAQAQVSPAGEELLPMPIAMAQVKELHDAREAVIVDARSAEQFAQGHIAGSIPLPLAAARKNAAAALDGKAGKDATVIAYCNGFSCHDSMELGKILIRAGYASVYVYEGGFPEWRDAGYPVAKGGL